MALRRSTFGLVAPAIAVALGAAALPAGAERSGPEPGEQLTLVGDDAFVVHPADEPLLEPVTDLSATGGYNLLGGVRSFALPAYTIVLIDSPGIEQFRGMVEASAAQIALETGLSISVAPGVVPDHDEQVGEILVRVSSSSPCGPLSSPGVVGCGGPRTTGGAIISGEVSLATNLGCEGIAISVVAHELGHAFGLAHFTGEIDGLLQLMYPSTSSNAPMFRAGDRAGLRALAGRPSAVVQPATVATPVAAPSTGSLAATDPLGEATVPSLSSPVTAAGTGALFSQPTVTRVLDTRLGIGLSGPFASGQSRTLSLASVLGAGQADAVVLNLTVAGADAVGFVTAHPAGGTRPTTSSANYTFGADAANLVIVKLGAGNTVELYNEGGTAHLIADLFGVFSSAGSYGFVPATPTRVLDTRESVVPGETGFPLGCEDWTESDDARLTAAGVPLASAAAEVVNLTGANTNAAGFISFRDRFDFPQRGEIPGTSNVNLAAGDTRANLAITPGEEWLVQNSASMVSDVIVDLAGWFVPPAVSPAASALVAVDPVRVLDTRNGIGLSGRFAPEQARRITLPAAGGVTPDRITAVVMNVTAVGPSSGGYVTAWPGGTARPNASNLNYDAGEIVPNLVIVKVGAGATVDLVASAGSPDLLADVMGYFVAP